MIALYARDVYYILRFVSRYKKSNGPGKAIMKWKRQPAFSANDIIAKRIVTRSEKIEIYIGFIGEKNNQTNQLWPPKINILSAYSKILFANVLNSEYCIIGEEYQYLPPDD